MCSSEDGPCSRGSQCAACSGTPVCLSDTLSVRSMASVERPSADLNSVRPKQLHGHCGAGRLSHLCGLKHKTVREAVAAHGTLLCALRSLWAQQQALSSAGKLQHSLSLSRAGSCPHDGLPGSLATACNLIELTSQLIESTRQAATTAPK